MKRQQVRILLLLISFLLFPVTIFYFSPYLIIVGALEGIVTGSFLLFSLLFAGSLLFGRLFCAYACPAGGLQEMAGMVNGKKAKQGKRDYIKYAIWIVWILAIALIFITSGGIKKIDPFYMTDHGVSVSSSVGYILYYFIIGLLFIPALIFGKRACCHYLCWMAPFMILGTKLRKKMKAPGLSVKVADIACVSCGRCTKHCPMGLEVESMVKNGAIDSSECILCGTCIDECPKKILFYSMKGEASGK